jgi:hypothetical protein
LSSFRRAIFRKMLRPFHVISFILIHFLNDITTAKKLR